MSNDLAIILALETTVRELDVRLALAALYARRGHRIFIVGGPSGQRVLKDIPRALFAGKHVIHPTAEHPSAYFEAKKNGTVVVHLAEEGGIFQGAEEDWAWNLDDQLIPRLLDPEDFVCTWGNFQRDHYRSRTPANPDNIRTTGHPRFDIYKTALRGFYAAEAAELRRRYGKFVIWCSNFGLANDAEGPWNTFSSQLGYEPAKDDVRLRFIGRWSHQTRSFAEFIELFHRMSARRRDVTFIIRPHPSDNHDFFRYAFGGVDNVKVVQEGSVAPWLLAASAMVHDGCTTALEAHMLGCRIVNFQPLGQTSHSFYLPNLFGHCCSTQDAAIDAVEAALEGTGPAALEADQLPERAHNIFANFRQDSFALFCDVLQEAEELARRRPRTSPNHPRMMLEEAKAIAAEESKHLVRRAFLPKNYRTALHTRQRFPGFERESIRRKVRTLREITGNPLECRFHSRNILELTSERAAS